MPPRESHALVLAFHTATGVALVATEYGDYDNTDHGVWGGTTGSDLEVLAGDVLLVRYSLCGSSGSQEEVAWEAHPELQCWVDRTTETRCASHAVACAPVEGQLRCAGLVVGDAVSEPSSASYVCGDSDLAPESETGPAPPPAWAMTVNATGTDVIVARERGTVPEPHDARIGTHPIAQLVTQARLAAIRITSDQEREAERARYDEEMDSY